MDGAGNPGYYGAVGIEGDRIRILRGDLSGVQAAQVLDATGRVVCPGFIDLHAHSALMALANPRHEPKVFQGITTELIGVDGISYAPMPSHEDLADAIRLNSGPGRCSTVDPAVAFGWGIPFLFRRQGSL